MLSAQSEAPHIMLDLSRAKVRSETTVRVKVFPHERDYPPHGIDLVRDQLVIESDKPCSLYASPSDKIVASGKALKRGLTFTFLASELGNEGRYLQCSQGFRILRPGKATNSYEGRLYIRAIDGGLEAINLVNLKEYLRGVVPSEVYRDWPMEALKSQAVAARTYAVYHLLNVRRSQTNRLWDVDDTIQFQAFTGTTLRHPRTDAAVEGTEGQILTYQGQVIQAFYHADSGGQTEEATAVWDNPIPFTISRPEAAGLTMKRTIWERALSLDELDKELQEAGILKAGQKLRQISVPLAGRSPSGRVRYLTAFDHKGRAVTFPLQVLRRLTGNLPSLLFDIDVQSASSVLLRGVGNGHGVGMSQMGAATLAAQKAWTHQKILAYYYVKTTLCNLNDKGQDSSLPNCYEDSSRYAAARRQPETPAG